ncbi:MAG: 2-hydroxyacyl-CoA dehydratase family protein [Treponema sp.]
MKIDKDFLVELRRNAYIECTENYLDTNTMVGIFGDDLPEELFYACGVVPVPIEGVDSHIFKFGKAGEGIGFCDVIRSTLIYLTTQKCPILYSCKMYVLEDFCTSFINVLKANTEKKVSIYKNDKELIQTLCSVYDTDYDENIMQNAKADLDYIKEVLEKIKYYSDVSMEELFLLEFYSKYMTKLSDRKKYFELLEKSLSFKKRKNNVEEVFAVCPRGNYKSIFNDSPNTKISRLFNNADYGYSHCIFGCKKEKNYKD